VEVLVRKGSTFKLVALMDWTANKNKTETVQALAHIVRRVERNPKVRLTP
jgi:hypothetical protein